MAAICVFCSSAPTIDPGLIDLAGEVGALIAYRKHVLVSGGGSVSMMGAVTRAARAHGGETIGVIPEVLMTAEVADTDSTHLHVTPDLRTRKEQMTALSDAFIVLPGGIGTLEELFDVWVGRTLALHTKPIVVCDPTGCFTAFRAALAGLTDAGLIRNSANRLVHWASSPEAAVAQIEELLAHPEPTPAPDQRDMLEGDA